MEEFCCVLIVSQTLIYELIGPLSQRSLFDMFEYAVTLQLPERKMNDHMAPTDEPVFVGVVCEPGSNKVIFHLSEFLLVTICNGVGLDVALPPLLIVKSICR